MFADAVRWGMLKENPCLKVQPPKPKQKEMSCLDEEGVQNLFNALDTEPIKYRALITMALMSGCRRGEIAALQWSNIDLENLVVYIKQSAAYTPNTGIQIKAPKTQSSIRKISLPASTAQLLKQYRVWWLEQKVKTGDLWQKSEKETQGDDWIDPEWVFCTWDGHIIHPDSITDFFKKILQRHNLPDMRLHDLRHTAATILIHAGLNVRAVAARMGHSNPNVTLKVYSHALQSADRQAAELMESFVTPKEAEKTTSKA